MARTWSIERGVLERFVYGLRLALGAALVADDRLGAVAIGVAFAAGAAGVEEELMHEVGLRFQLRLPIPLAPAAFKVNRARPGQSRLEAEAGALTLSAARGSIAA